MKCPKCKKPKEIEDFSKDSDKPSGLKGSCKECIAKERKPPTVQIFCIKMQELMNSKACVPDIDPLKCPECPDRQLNNIHASSDTLTPQEESDGKYSAPSNMGILSEYVSDQL